MFFRGAYASGSTYYPNNILTYANSVYICKQQATGIVPTNTTYYSLLTAPPDLTVSTTGSGTTPSSFTLTSDGSSVTLNKPS